MWKRKEISLVERKGLDWGWGKSRWVTRKCIFPYFNSFIFYMSYLFVQGEMVMSVEGKEDDPRLDNTQLPFQYGGEKKSLLLLPWKRRRFPLKRSQSNPRWSSDVLLWGGILSPSVKEKMWRPIKEEEAPKERPITMMICAQKRPFWYSSSSSSFWVVHTSNKNVASHMIKGRRENTWPKKIVEDDGLGKKKSLTTSRILFWESSMRPVIKF